MHVQQHQLMQQQQQQLVNNELQSVSLKKIEEQQQLFSNSNNDHENDGNDVDDDDDKDKDEVKVNTIGTVMRQSISTLNVSQQDDTKSLDLKSNQDSESFIKEW